MSEPLNIRRISGKRIADRYCIVDEIGKGGMGVVYRAIPFDDPSHSVAIKVIQRSGQLSSEDLLRFQKEAALMSQLYHPNIISFHELGLLAESDDGEIGSGYYIVMELATGSNLKDTLSKDGRKDLAFFFQVGLQVSEGLAYTHGKNIIHRDIKPQNIIVSPAWKDQRGVLVKVLDFGVARLAEAMHNMGEGQERGRGFEEFAGTPLYMAPEQTRLFEAPVDHRVDLYSLGCVLYEILTGKPPFSADTRSKLERQHVFSSPEPITSSRPDVPQIVEQIVLKLLAKHPDDRYQTAFGLHADLLRAKSKIDSRFSAAGISFPLGLKDRFQAVSAQLPLSGREKELQTLINGFTACSQERGRSHLTVIRGEPGIGKSRLMAEFRSYLIERKVRFISGSFSQHENSLPYNALANAFNDYLLRILKSNSPQTEELRSKVKNKLGATAHRVAQVVPGLRPFLPEEVVSDYLDSPLEEESQNFAKVFSDFTRCLASEEQPLVFMFDNMHWADDKSLALIDEFFSHNNSQRFYMVVTHSTIREVEGSKFGQFVEKFSKLRRRFMDVRLGSLTETAVHEIAGNILRSPESVTPEFTNYLYSRSTGNAMYIVELMRQLVTQDFVFLRTINANWEYDIEDIKRVPIQLQSVDLVLNSLQSYDEVQRQLLEVAAAIGHTFHFEMLLLDGQKQSIAVMQALQKAIEDGLITRVADELDLKHLGKTFMFTHKKARDAIYENITLERRRALHLAIARKLDKAVTEKSSKVIFSLAHHFNAAMIGGKATDQTLAHESFKYNGAAGRFALQAGSWQSAEKYFENAFLILTDWPAWQNAATERAELMEYLADLAALQRRHGSAVKKYRDLLESSIPESRKYQVASKAVYLQSINGYISESVNLCLRYLGRAFQGEYGRWPLFLAGLGILRDVAFHSTANHRIYRLLQRAYRRGKSATESVAPAAGGRVKLIEGLIPLRLRQEPRRVILDHVIAFNDVASGQADAGDMIRVLGERALFIGWLGFLRPAYRFVDLAIDVARSLRIPSVQGYLTLMRAMVLDYQKPRPGDVIQTLARAQKLIVPDQDRMSYAQAFVFGMFVDLQRGKIDDVIAASRKIPDIVPTRNWLSARAHAVAVLAQLLRGNRDVIVKTGDQYLRRRKQVHARMNDTFVEMIASIVAYAKGEGDRAAESYRSVTRRFLRGQAAEFLMPYEEDLVGFYCLIFPGLFEGLNGKSLLAKSEIDALFKSLESRIGKICGSERAIPLLLRARIHELRGGKKVKPAYDKALQKARVGDEAIVELFAYFWFGMYLMKESTSRTDYLKRAWDISEKLGIKTVAEFIERSLRKNKRSARARSVHDSLHAAVRPSGHGGEVSSITRSGVPIQESLPVSHLAHVGSLMFAGGTVRDAVAGSLDLVARRFSVGRCYFLMWDQVNSKFQVAYPNEGDQPEWINSIAPYFNVRSTLFLPITDSSFKGGTTAGTGQTQTLNYTGTNSKVSGGMTLSAGTATGVGATGTFIPTPPPVKNSGRTHVSDSEPVDSTVVVSDDGKDSTVSGSLAHGVMLDDFTQVSFEGGAEVAPAGLGKRKRLKMSALVPVRHENESFGLLVLENMDLKDSDGMTVRRELDMVGAQLGIVLAKVQGEADGHAARPIDYKAGGFNLEPVSWLNIHTQGTMRLQRETTWYLGLNVGEDHYLLAYVNLDAEASVRERLSVMLWYQTLVARSLAVGSGRSGIDMNEFRDEATSIIRAAAKDSIFHRIVFAFTLFDRQAGGATSGHFGSSRPYVLGQENVVSPLNEIVANLAQGQELRYWDVSASVRGDHLYMLTYDSSKFDSEVPDSVRRKMAELRGRNREAVTVSDRVQALLVAENIPRYYVAVVQENTNHLALLKTDVAS